MNKKSIFDLFKQKLQFSLTAISVIPILALGIVLSVTGIASVRSTAEDEINMMLTGMCQQLRQEFYEKYPGDFSSSDGVFYSGDHDIADSFYLLDSYHTHFKAEVTIFFGNTRAITTIKDARGVPLTGTVQEDTRVLSTVKTGRNYISKNIEINGDNYYGVYVPLYDHGIVAGMVFAGVTDKAFLSNTKNFTLVIVLLTAVMLVITSIIIGRYSHGIGRMLSSIKSYLGLLVQKQTPDVAMAPSVLKRSDEIGDLARYAVEAGNQLKTIIGRDTLTGLYNRRTGRQFLGLLWDTARINFTSLALVMCDIDFFKKVNDAYGHDEGDVVLKTVGEVLSKYCDNSNDSFAIRWGGEEFLMGFLMSGPQTLKIVNNIRDEIKAKEFTAPNGETFKITMTFGLVTAASTEEISSVVARADAKLYKGKENGRDQIVV